MAETETRNRRKVRTGVVISLSGEKSCIVQINDRKRHPKYDKMMTVSKKLHCHDEQGIAGIGDTVTVMETRPISKTKHWRVVKVVEKAQ
jgi:small subunit ribosomal protein S17